MRRILLLSALALAVVLAPVLTGATAGGPAAGRILIAPPNPPSIPSPHDGEVGRGEILSSIKAPNTKLQRSSKSQAPRQRACDRFWNLKFGISLELGVWNLVFRSLTVLPTTRNIQRVVGLAMLWSLNLDAQLAPASKPAWQTPMRVETGPHQRVWQMVASDLNGGTTNQPDPGRGVVEMATGMNYWDGRQWVPSDPSFEVTPDAFVAERLQYKVQLNGNLNRVGAVTVTTRDG